MAGDSNGSIVKSLQNSRYLQQGYTSIDHLHYYYDDQTIKFVGI